MAQLGLSKQVEQELEALCATRGWKIADVLGKRAGSPEVRLRYDRGGGSITSGMPSSQHMYYAVDKGWTAVVLEPEDRTPERVDRPDVSPELESLAKQDKRGLYTRGEQSAIFSLRERASLTAKGWTFSGDLEDSEHAADVANAKVPGDGRSVEESQRHHVLPIFIEPRA